SAVAMLMVWLGTSVGALAWGVVASAVGVRTSLLAAAVLNVAVAAVAALVLPVTPYRGSLEPSSLIDASGS
ncbi:MAG: hypothetical protein WCC60_18240, partial [Ilumatobacteraceae bacterium]